MPTEFAVIADLPMMCASCGGRGFDGLSWRAFEIRVKAVGQGVDSLTLSNSRINASWLKARWFARERVVASGDPVTLFDFVEEALDQIPGRVEMRAEARLAGKRLSRQKLRTMLLADRGYDADCLVGGPFVIGEFVAHDSRQRLISLPLSGA